MIGYLKGSILENADGKMLLDVGSIGYAITVPQNPDYLGLVEGKPAELYIHTHVREDALDLYGFATRGEKELFLTLLSVTGIGPKGAIGILSKIGPQELIEAIMNGDKDALVQIPGIGKKTAERVVVELADTVRKKLESGGFASSRGNASPILRSQIQKSGTAADPMSGTMIREAKTALVGLGYREQDIGPLLSRVMAEAESRPRKVEDLIRKALQQLV